MNNLSKFKRKGSAFLIALGITFSVFQGHEERKILPQSFSQAYSGQEHKDWFIAYERSKKLKEENPTKARKMDEEISKKVISELNKENLNGVYTDKTTNKLNITFKEFTEDLLFKRYAAYNYVYSQPKLLAFLFDMVKVHQQGHVLAHGSSLAALAFEDARQLLANSEYSTLLKKTYKTQTINCIEQSATMIATYAGRQILSPSEDEAWVDLVSGIYFDSHYYPKGQGHQWVNTKEGILDVSMPHETNAIHYVPIFSTRLTIDKKNKKISSTPQIKCYPSSLESKLREN